MDDQKAIKLFGLSALVFCILMLAQFVFSDPAPFNFETNRRFLKDEVKKTMRFKYDFAVGGGSDVAITTQDQFGRTIDMYKGAIFRDPGYKADQTTRIIPNTEASDGTAGPSTYTSIYAVNYSTDHFYGWQFKDLSAAVEDLGKINNGVIYRTYISWAIGLMNASTRSIGRLYGLKMS